jgi:hypothetical protein
MVMDGAGVGVGGGVGVGTCAGVHAVKTKTKVSQRRFIFLSFDELFLVHSISQ